MKKNFLHGTVAHKIVYFLKLNSTECKCYISEIRNTNTTITL